MRNQRTNRRFTTHLAITVALLTSFLITTAATAQTTEPNAQAVQRGKQAIAGISKPDGFTASLFAAEPMVKNPVAFTFDEQGRIYVAESFRQSKGIEDNRSKPFWLLDDLAATTIEDRLAYYNKYADRFQGGMDYFTKYDDRITIVEDTNGDGAADYTKIFADGFNEPLDGTGAGLLVRNGDVYYTNIPNLWKLNDTDGDDRANMREKLSTGYGVRTALRGHDMHGLVWGPDGKIYFSIGDRGYNVTLPDGTVLTPPLDTGRGAVFRCNPDGSGLEVFATGLRNPQELAFDQFGNLFTGDNNSDAGDKARLVYVVQHGDSGWDMAYQTLDSRAYSRGQWTAEKLWYPYHENQPAWIVPPIDWVESGPSGFTYYPGTGLRDRYNGHFFLCDFRGQAGTSGLRSFAVEPNGAGFTMVDHHQVIGNLLATDADFGYDGKLYITDWINGWEGEGAGRIYTFTDTTATDADTVSQVQQLFKAGFTQRPADELAQLLAHTDMRVRLRAQFTLADKGPDTALPVFTAATQSSNSQLNRIHGIWGLGQLADSAPAALQTLTQLLNDSDPEIRAQSLKALADHKHAAPAQRYTQLLKDDSLRVRYFAAMALAEIQHKPAVEPLLAMLSENADTDPFLRHAGIVALAAANDADALLAHAKDDSRSARLAVLVALRRQADPRLSTFLNDPDIHIVTEAARAINDLPLTSEFPKLADLIEPIISGSITDAPEPLLRRVINANFRLAGSDRAQLLTTYIADADQPLAMRTEALDALADWTQPSPRDRVLSFYRPLPERISEGPVRALQADLPAMLSNSEGQLRAKIIQVATQYGRTIDAAFLNNLIADASQPVRIRIESLRSLVESEKAAAEPAIDTALSDLDPQLRAEARHLLATINPDRALIELSQTILYGDLIERQHAYTTLASLESQQADALLAYSLSRLSAGQLFIGEQLDLLEAAQSRAPANTQINAILNNAKRAVTASNPQLGELATALAGGDPEAGRQIFLTHAAAQCIRCHTLDGTGGNAGPVLNGVAKRGDRTYLLESLTNPGAKIAEGFTMSTITLKNGSTVAGTARPGPDNTLLVYPPLVTEPTIVNKADIANLLEIKASSMPPMNGLLNPHQLRDVVAFLATLKTDPPATNEATHGE